MRVLPRAYEATHTDIQGTQLVLFTFKGNTNQPEYNLFYNINNENIGPLNSLYIHIPFLISLARQPDQSQILSELYLGGVEEISHRFYDLVIQELPRDNRRRSRSSLAAYDAQREEFTSLLHRLLLSKNSLVTENSKDALFARIISAMNHINLQEKEKLYFAQMKRIDPQTKRLYSRRNRTTLCICNS